MSESQIDIDEIIRLAYAKGHAEGMLDIITVADTKGRDYLDRQRQRLEIILEGMQPEIAEARLTGYLL